MKYMRCRDIGVNCDFEARGETMEDVLAQCARHARLDHGLMEIPFDLVQKVRAAIWDEPPGSSD
jgi:predicted small metal-binding protein